LFCWHFQPLPPPQSLDTLVVDLPACVPQQSSNPTIAIAAVLASQLDHVSYQALFVSTAHGQLPLRRSMLAQHTAGAAFGYAKCFTYTTDADTAASGAQKLCCAAAGADPRAASARISLSKVRSDTAFLSRSFSF